MLNIYFLVFCFSVAAGYFLTPFFIELFLKGRSLAKNFRGEYIPQGTGIVFILYSLPWYVIYLLFLYFESRLSISYDVLAVMAALFMVGFAGFIDDTLGGRDTLGFKGHFRALFSGKLTTGALKAVVGLLAAFAVSIFLSAGLKELIVNTLVIVLFTNLLNLLDLRPGRAVKFYIIWLIVLAVSGAIAGRFANFRLFVPLIGSVIGYFPFDLKARCMMGDAGSNVLGMSAGILAAMQYNLSGKIILLIFLLAIHLFAEKFSLSDVIEHNRVLSYIDYLGRQ